MYGRLVEVAGRDIRIVITCLFHVVDDRFRRMIKVVALHGENHAVLALSVGHYH